MVYEALRLSITDNKKTLLSRQNVVSVGVGFKYTNGERTDEECIVVGVTHKLPECVLTTGDIIPRRVGAHKTDVVELGHLRAFEHETGKFRPAPGGVSIGHQDITAGTLGCLVVKDDEIFILSNNHVLANSNAAEIGDPILQPGPVDGGQERTDQIGTLAAFVPINFGGGGGTGIPLLDFILSLLCQFFGIFCQEGGAVNTVDAALAKPTSNDMVVKDILDIGPPTGSAQVELDESIQKSGRTTDVTQGRVLQLHATVQVQYGAGQIATFEEQIIAGPMGAGGDSGSAVSNDTNQVIGLLFAGSDQTTIINPIDYVLDELGVEILV